MWVENVHQAFRYVGHPLVVYIFRTDASASGWGITTATNVSCSLGSSNRYTVILIPNFCSKIEANQAKDILEVPAWATQALYIRVLPMMGQQPLFWTPGSQLLVHPSTNSTHRVQNHLKLIVWPLI